MQHCLAAVGLESREDDVIAQSLLIDHQALELSPNKESVHLREHIEEGLGDHAKGVARGIERCRH